jgi:hypothetical protein
MKVQLLLILFLVLTSCKTPTRKEIDATLWLNNTNAKVFRDLCAREPVLLNIGFYRKLNDGRKEFISFCSPRAVNYFGILDRDLNNMLDKYLPEPQDPNGMGIYNRVVNELRVSKTKE